MRLLGVLLAAVLLAACSGAEEAPAVSDTGGPTGGSGTTELQDGEARRDAEWVLEEVTADGLHVAYAVGYDGCGRYLGPQVLETDDQVRIAAGLAMPTGEVACEGVLNVSRDVVELDAPLGDRVLTGCQRPGCLDLADPMGIATDPQRPALTDSTIVTATADGVVGLDRETGAEVWRIAHQADPFDGYLEQPTAVGDQVVAVLTQSPEAVHFLDPADGSIRWSGTGRNVFADLGAQMTGDTAYLTPGNSTVEARSPLTGELRWAARPEQPVHRLAPVEGGVLVLSGIALSGDGPGSTTATLHAAVDGAIRWQRDIPGAPQDLILRDGLAIIEVEGAVRAIDLADGAERWRLLPFNTSGLLDLGPVIAGYPGRFGDPATLFDPTTGEITGELPVSGLGDDRSPDLRRHARLGDDAVMAGDGQLRRRDVTTTPSTEPDAAASWTLDLATRLSGAVVDDEVVAVSTPLGARLLDAATGELIWAHADVG